MIEKTFLNPATNKKWRIEIDGHIIRTCLNGGKVKEILCDSAFQVKSKAASAKMCIRDSFDSDKDVFCVYSQFIDDLMMLSKMIRAACADEKSMRAYLDMAHGKEKP